MTRPLRALAALALALPLLTAAGAASAEDRQPSWAAENHVRRQALRYRDWPEDAVPGRILVTAATASAAADLAEQEDGTLVGDRHVLLLTSPGSERQVAARVAARGGVIAVEPDRKRQAARVPDDPGFDEQWAHTLSKAPQAWDESTGDASVTVAVLDTGVDASHPDLAGNIVEQADASTGTPKVWPSARDNDPCDVGHGTMVAGVIGAIGDNDEGVAGVAWDVSIVDVSLSSPATRCAMFDSAIIAALEHVVDRDEPVDIVNLSLGAVAGSCPTALQSALDDARDAGVLVVAASGNEQEILDEPTSVPASCDGVVSVGAVGSAGVVAPYSNANKHVDLVAPGGDSQSPSGDRIVTTDQGGGYVEVEGTSFAAPYVAGVAALLRSIDADLTPDDLESILEHTAEPAGPSGRDAAYGWGIVDAGAATQAASSGDPLPPEDDPSFDVDDDGIFAERIRSDEPVTAAIDQAVAVSEYVFDDGQAMHAVIARSDDFADALAGSSLGFGVGPLLFTRSTGELASATRAELLRVLDAGSTVYLLGGTAAIPSVVEQEIEDIGYDAVRLAGTTRHATAVAVADAVADFLDDADFAVPPVAIVATAFNWPDAVAAGSLGAFFGMPIVLTPATSLDATTRSYLARTDLEQVYVVGGTAAISDDVRRHIVDATGLSSANVIRLAGVDRSGTAVAISSEFEDLFSEIFEDLFGIPVSPPIVAAVNLRREDGYAHVLSGSVIAGAGAAVFAPVEGTTGDTITPATQDYLCFFPALPFVVGGRDLVSEPTSSLLQSLMSGNAPACR